MEAYFAENFQRIYYHISANTSDGGTYMMGIFVWGNLLIVAISGVLSHLTKSIKALYDFFGYISSSSLIAFWVNIIILVPSYIFFHPHTNTVLYLGGVITAISYLVVDKYFKKLYALGESLSVAKGQKEKHKLIQKLLQKRSKK